MGILLSHELEELRQKQKQDVLYRFTLSASEPGPGPTCIPTKDTQHMTAILLQNHRGVISLLPI